MSAAQKSAPQFVIGQMQDSDAPRQVKAVRPAELYHAEYSDGEGRAQSRLVVVVTDPKSKEKGVFMFQERISGSLVATQAVDWFAKDFLKKLGNSDGPAQL